ncbi:MAG: YihY/virulence factor BrkB family protein [Xanthobacteraceae bacterium]
MLSNPAEVGARLPRANERRRRAAVAKNVLLAVLRRISEHRLLTLAAGVTFYIILAIFPAIAALVSVYGLFSDPSTIAKQLDALSTVLPPGAVEVVGNEIDQLVAQGNSALSLAFAGSLAISIWSANAGMKALFDVLNVVYDQRERRGLVKLHVVSLTVTIGALILTLLLLATVAVLPAALDTLGLRPVLDQLLRVARWPLLFLAVNTGLAILYRYGPSRVSARLPWVTWGSACATVAWVAASVLFSWYATHFANYNKTYGSLGAAVVFMTWIWISTIIVLVGATIDAELERAR